MFSIIEGFKGLKKARLASFLAITSIALCIFLIGLFLVSLQNINKLVGSVREKIEIEVFLINGIDQKKIGSVKESIAAIEGVKSLRFVSKKEAAQRFKDEFGQDIYEVLDYNPLPPSFILTLDEDFRNLSAIQDITEQIKGLSYIDAVVYQQFLLRTIDRYINIVFMVGMVLGLLITFIAIALIYNTIRLTIYARRDIIYIMRLVGATQRFIRRPFIVEGIIQGFIGSLLSGVVVFYSLQFIKSTLYSSLDFDPRILAGLILFGMLIGMISARLGVAKYLRNV